MVDHPIHRRTLFRAAAVSAASAGIPVTIPPTPAAAARADVTLSGSAGVLYINGGEVARNSSSTLRPGDLGGTTQNWIGRSQHTADSYLSAAVDDLRLYRRALSATEISQLAAG